MYLVFSAEAAKNTRWLSCARTSVAGKDSIAIAAVSVAARLMAFRPVVIRYTIFDLRPFVVSVNPDSFEPDGGRNVSIHSHIARAKRRARTLVNANGSSDVSRGIPDCGIVNDASQSRGHRK